MVAHYGNPSICEEKTCSGISKVFDWAIKHGREYSHNRKDYRRLCRSCHRKYDMTPERREQGIKNLREYNPFYGTKRKNNV